VTATGKVKFYSHERGFGFIKTDDPGPDLFLHYTQIPADVDLDDGARVGFEIEPNKNQT
jgi:CspA family cold shock protein